MNTELPRLVDLILDITSKKLGRPAHCRRAKNSKEYYIQDPVFSFVQHGMKKGSTGYRVGFMVDTSKCQVWFRIVHSPIMARLFKENLVFSSLLAVVKATACFRHKHGLWRDSANALREVGDDFSGHSFRDLASFVKWLRSEDKTAAFVEDLFPKVPNTGVGEGLAPVAGNTFYLLLADHKDCLSDEAQVKLLINRSWPLFLCLYPIKAIERRTAALARSLRARNILKVCEFSRIVDEKMSGADRLCRGTIQGAHIKPHSRGGSDKFENGLWLCEYHHRATEGKLVGVRSAENVSVRFVDRKKRGQ